MLSLPYLAAALAYSAAVPANDTVYLTVAYCSTPFAGKGAVVKVEHSGEFHVVNKFELPDVSLGCPMEESVNFMTDPHHRTASKIEFQGRRTHWSWTSEWGYLSVIDLDKGHVAHQTKGSSTDLNIFDGFTNFKVGAPDATSNIGLSPHVTEDGFCKDGCFRAGTQFVEDGAFKHLAGDDEKHTGALPFKEVMSDTSFHDSVGGVYYAQGAYPLNEAARCDPDETKQCMFAINTTTGSLLSSKATPDFVVYKYEDGPIRSDGSVLAWGFGFQETCGKDLNSFAFARVHLASAQTELVACIPKDAIIHYNPNMGAFSHDNRHFAHANGNPETGSMSLKVFETATGQVLLDSKLTGLPAALGVSAETPFVAVWGIAHMPPLPSTS